MNHDELIFCEGFDDSDEIKIVKNGKKSKWDLRDQLKTWADICGIDEKYKWLINWAKLSEFVQKIKKKDKFEKPSASSI